MPLLPSFIVVTGVVDKAACSFLVAIQLSFPEAPDNKEPLMVSPLILASNNMA
ncbi:hypothetical protein D3C78_1580490 [compost metagenome]